VNPILIPLRNGLALTKAAHATFCAQDIGPVSILYIDNRSMDGTTQWLASLTGVHTIHNSQPKSVASSWNQGLRWWFSQGAEWVLVVNNDVLLRPDTYRHLVAAGGQFVTAVGTRDLKKIEPPYVAPSYTDVRRHPDYSCALIRREAWQKMGQFDESYQGAYAEDAESHLALHRLGIDAYCLELPFWHLGAGTIKNASPLEAAEIHRQADANRALFRERHGVEVGSDEYYALFGSGRPPEEATT
jgi:hypothetical protein